MFDIGSCDQIDWIRQQRIAISMKTLLKRPHCRDSETSCLSTGAGSLNRVLSSACVVLIAARLRQIAEDLVSPTVRDA
jgi:hypothetical protein